MAKITSIQDLIEAQYGIRTAPEDDPLTATVLVTPTRIAPNNPRRTYMLIENIGAVSLYIGNTQEVASGQGILLTANGGVYELIWNQHFSRVAFEWWAIAIGANGTVRVSTEVMQQ